MVSFLTYMAGDRSRLRTHCFPVVRSSCSTVQSSRGGGSGCSLETLRSTAIAHAL